MELYPAPDQLDPPSDELHVWWIELSGVSPSQRRGASHTALRQVLATYLGQDPERIEISRGEGGKPRLAAATGLEFNLSHSAEVALVAINGACRVGVDVEKVEPRREAIALAERALEPDDVAAVREAAPDQRSFVFHQCWARHEARLKCLGIGIFRAAPGAADPVAVETLEVGREYAAAVAIAASELPPLRCWTFGPPLPETAEWVS